MRRILADLLDCLFRLGFFVRWWDVCRERKGWRRKDLIELYGGVTSAKDRGGAVQPSLCARGGKKQRRPPRLAPPRHDGRQRPLIAHNAIFSYRPCLVLHLDVNFFTFSRLF